MFDLNEVKLTDEELLLLDGKCSEKVQTAVDLVKTSKTITGLASPEHAKFVVSVVQEAQTSGKLIFSRSSISYCPVCKTSGSYRLYKSGKNKGRFNYDKPTYIFGVELAYRSVIIRGHVTVGCCSQCWETVKPFVLTALESVKAQMPEALTGHPEKYTRYDKRKCSSCGWEGHEGEMGFLPALMGGNYRGECPKCKVKNEIFGPQKITAAEGFVVVEENRK